MTNIPIRKLDEYGILMKFEKMTGKVRPIFQSDYYMTTNLSRILIRTLQELDDHIILTIDFKDLDQNSSGQPSWNRNDIFE